MNDEIFEKIKEFAKRESFNEVYFTRSTEIQTDLGIYGDDAIDFFEKFSKEFNVDVTNFEIGKYFKGEGDPILTSIIDFLRRKKSEPRRKITLGNLEKAAIAEKLDKTIID